MQIMSAEKEPPQFTLKNVSTDIVNGIGALIHNPFCTRIVIPLIITATSIITKVIIKNVAYTEIDFKTYMQQIDMINDGEIDYNYIRGDSGPIVYPAGFVEIFQLLHKFSNGGEDIQFCQGVFGYLFVFTNLLTCIVYTAGTSMPPWPFYLLLLSKRIFSIYVLRLFNDCFTTVFMICVVLVLQQASIFYSLGLKKLSFLILIFAADVYSVAISIKMNALLYLPAFIIAVFFLCEESLLRLACVLSAIPVVQIMIGWRFLLPLIWNERTRYLRHAYISNAFNFRRKFLYKWTVNWKFLPEEWFLSDIFSVTLLIAHVSVLFCFIFTRYISPRITKKKVLRLIGDALKHPFKKNIMPNNSYIRGKSGPQLIFLLFATCNFIGVIFARSLHYQFLSWYFWQLPYMLYMTKWGLPTCFALWCLHEWCWNVYPTTALSSATLVIVLLSILYRVWIQRSSWFEVAEPESDDNKSKKNI